MSYSTKKSRTIVPSEKKKIKATKKIKYSINCEKHEITKALRNPQEKFNVAQFGVAMSLTPFGNPVV